ncbi:MAG TPA: G1 family glutamic endopeptidase [Candidatus Limnocylindrales bacterium]|jgi:hypothetical protein
MTRDRGWSRRAAAIAGAVAIVTLAAACGGDVSPTPAPPGPSALAAAPTQAPTPTPRPSASPSPVASPSASPTPSARPTASPAPAAGDLPACTGTPSTAEGAILSATSLNWGGYIARQSGARVVCVQARWTEPKLRCPTKGVRSEAIWVGIDGDNGATTTRPLIQVGTAGECRGGVERHFAWHQVYPNQPYSRSFAAVIKPGDRMAASVVFRKREFVLTVVDLTTGATSQVHERAPKAARASAEWIVEAPTGDCPGHCHQLTLPSFAPIRFTSAQARLGDHLDGVVGPWNRERTTMVTPKGAPLVKIGNVSSGGDSFTVSRP